MARLSFSTHLLRNTIALARMRRQRRLVIPHDPAFRTWIPAHFISLADVLLQMPFQIARIFVSHRAIRTRI